MPANEEQNWANELRQSQIGAVNNPAADPPEEVGAGEEATGEVSPEEMSETVLGPEAERGARASLLAQRLAILQQKAAAKTTKLIGRVQQVASFLLQRIGTTLVSFGLGTGITIIGLIIGLPLLIIGAICVVLGFVAAMTARLTIAAGQTLEAKAKATEKKMQKEESGEKGGGAAEAAGAGLGAMKKYAGLIAAPFIYIGCTILGLLSGFFLLITLLGAAAGAIFD